MDGFLPPLVDSLKRKKWLSIWQGTCKRSNYMNQGLRPLESEADFRVLQQREFELFGTRKYIIGASVYFTVLTNSEEHNGAIYFYKVTALSSSELAAEINLVAVMPEVLRDALKSIRRKGGPNRIDLAYKDGTLCRRHNGQSTLPWPAIVTDADAGKDWQRSGWGWRQALGLILGE